MYPGCGVVVSEFANSEAFCPWWGQCLASVQHAFQLSLSFGLPQDVLSAQEQEELADRSVQNGWVRGTAGAGEFDGGRWADDSSQLGKRRGITYTLAVKKVIDTRPNNYKFRLKAR